MTQKFTKLIVQRSAGGRIGIHRDETFITIGIFTARQRDNLAVITGCTLRQIALCKGIEGRLFVARAATQNAAKLEKDQHRCDQEE